MFGNTLSSAVQYALAIQSSLGLGDTPLVGSQSSVSTLSFSQKFELLGPFQIGTREAPWGADPLEIFGGFRALEYDNAATFRSSLGANGTIKWSTINLDVTRNETERRPWAIFTVSFPDIDFDSLRSIYGWSALQYQAWVRISIYVDSEWSQTVVIYTGNILEFWMDDQHFFGGDLYTLYRASVVSRLEPGRHRLDVRLVRDVRSMAGLDSDISVKILLQASFGGLQLGSDVLISDIIGKYGPLASSYASVVVRNEVEKNIVIRGIRGPHNQCETKLLSDSPVVLVPGQSRPLGFQLACIEPYSVNLELGVVYAIGDDSTEHTVSVTANPTLQTSLHSPQKFTYLHPGGVVSYAILRPPPASSCSDPQSVPVMIVLHGGGVDADSEELRTSLDDVQDLCAWIIFPAGLTPWSGDDWHLWGLADVEAAVRHIHHWIAQVNWKGPGVDTGKWLMTGHSNGGQGAWYALTHQPDRMIAVAPVSAPSSIQNYVPYTFWHAAHPGRTAIQQAALATYRHELLLPNAKDIPVLIQHGTVDDNVPVYNSRLMYELLNESNADCTFYELPGKNHWYEGVMETKPLQDFYRKHLGHPHLHNELGNFTVVTANTGVTGPKGGIKILQLEIPAQLGKIEVTSDGDKYALRTSNVLGFTLPNYMHKNGTITVDRQTLLVNVTENSTKIQRVTGFEPSGPWHNETDFEGYRQPSRTGRQQSTADAILATNGSFNIVTHSKAAKNVALQISRNLCQYFYADTVITSDYAQAKAQTGNVISVAIGDDLPDGYMQHPIRVLSPTSLTVQDITGFARLYDARDGLGLAAIFLRPLPDERLELVVWGADLESLDLAARLVPMLTGTGVPDFVVADKTMLLKGLEGTLAMGWFDGYWDVSRNSYFT